MQKNLFLVKPNKRWADYIISTYHYENFNDMEKYNEKEKELYEMDKQVLKQYIARIEAITESTDVSKIQPIFIMYLTILFSVFTAVVNFYKVVWGFIALFFVLSILVPYVIDILIFARNRWTKLVYLKTRFEQILKEREDG